MCGIRSSDWLVFACLCLGGAPHTAGESTSPASGGKPIPAELAGLRERWSAAMEEFAVPGMAVVVTRDDQIIYLDTFGYRDIDKKLPVTPNTTFYVASCTKPFTAMGIQILADAGKVDLDAPVKRYLPRFELPDDKLTERATIRDLLCHRHGISCGPVVLLDAYAGEITEDRYYRLLKSNTVLEGKVNYSNVHFTLAGRVIESASGRPWRDFLAEALFTPAGMASATGYADAMYARDDVALPYEVASTGFRPASQRKCDATMHAAGGLGLSISDLARWLRLNINGGEIDGKRILSAPAAAQMLELQSEAAEGKIRAMKGFGLGWQIGTFRENGPKYVSHDGGYVGAGAHMSFLPEKRIGVAIVTNSGPAAYVFIDQVVSIDIYSRLLGGEPIDLLDSLRKQAQRMLPKMREQADQAARPASVVGDGRLTLPVDTYCGEYRNDDYGQVRVARAGDSLDIRLGHMSLLVVGCESDQLSLRVVERPRDARFEVSGTQATAFFLSLEGGEIRFERRK